MGTDVEPAEDTIGERDPDRGRQEGLAQGLDVVGPAGLPRTATSSPAWWTSTVWTPGKP